MYTDDSALAASAVPSVAPPAPARRRHRAALFGAVILAVAATPVARTIAAGAATSPPQVLLAAKEPPPALPTPPPTAGDHDASTEAPAVPPPASAGPVDAAGCGSAPCRRVPPKGRPQPAEGGGRAESPRRPPAAPSGPANPRAFSFIETDGAGRPARWDPCVEVRWAYNPDGAPAGAEAFVAEGVRILAATGGLRFRFVGTTSFRPFQDPSSAQPADVDAVVGFGDGRDNSSFRAGTAGLGGISWAQTTAGPKVQSGRVLINVAALRSLPPGFGGGRTQGSLLLHELGHMVGLDHVADGRQVMNAVVTDGAPAGYAAGDQTGLAKVGRSAGCFPQPAAPTTTTSPRPTTTTTAPTPTTTTAPRPLPLNERAV